MQKLKSFPGVILLIFGILFTGYLSAQCGVGYTQAQTNWDKLDYYYNSGSGLAPYGYSGGNFVSNAMEQTQKFAIGPNYFTIATSAPGIINGTNGTHTGDLANYTGDDVQFTPSANLQTITITFNTEVKNASFVLYDLDGGLSFGVSAQSASLLTQAVSVAFQSSTILSNIGAVPNAPVIKATASTLANNVNDGSATITVGGPVKKIVITMTTIGSDPVFWLSDIIACVNQTFPTNYQQSFNNQPWQSRVTNEADYFIATPDNNNAYMLDPATGKAWFLFQDPANNYMNSFAYDPGNHWLYYISEGAGLNKNNKALKKYDFSTNTISTVMADISASLNIPTFNAGVESAGASFYNGQLFLGIEGGQFSATSSRKSIVWRIDFDGSGVPSNAVQVYAIPSYSGVNIVHDWADFTVKDGVLQNFNSAKNGTGVTAYTYSSFTAFDMMTGDYTTYVNPNPANQYAGQTGMDWAGNMYSLYSTVQKYNGNGTLGSLVSISTISGPAWVGNASDGSDPFRPKCDFGDAPASYDPIANKPAVHERTDSIRLGNTWDMEWVKRGTTTVEDVDDGLTYVPILTPGGNYFPQVKVYNNSGSNATLIGWLDYNNNGLFDAGEATTPITVPSSNAYQNFYLTWSAVNTPLVPGQFTYLRIRITAENLNMTSADATGYFFNGEVEDYKVTVDNFPLAVRNLSFDARAENNRSVILNWSVTEDPNFGGYEVERSANNSNWQRVAIVSGNGAAGVHSYNYIDQHPIKGTSYYRLHNAGMTGPGQFSEVKKIQLLSTDELVTFAPNPVTDGHAVLSLQSLASGSADVRILNAAGNVRFRQHFSLVAGNNSFNLSMKDYPAGLYVIEVMYDGNSIDKKIMIK